MSEFKVGDRVEFYFGDDKCEGIIKSVKPHGRYEITDDDYIFYDTSIDNITKITKEKKKTTLEELEKRIEKLEKYASMGKYAVDRKENVSNFEKMTQKSNLLSEDERVILRNLDKEWEWIVRDNNGFLCLFDEYKPFKGNYEWKSDGTALFLIVFNHLFQFIKWEDEEPYNIEELLKG